MKKITGLLLITFISITIFAGCNTNSSDQQNNQTTDSNTTVSTPTTTTATTPTTSTPTPTTANENSKPDVSLFKLAEINKHNTATDCWILIDGKVYEVTEFIASGKHEPIIVEGCGIDATEMFQANEKHMEQKPQELLLQYDIGKIKE